MTRIRQEQFSEIVSLLVPYVRNERDRKALITPPFRDYPNVYDRIDWTGDAKAFSTGLVELLVEHGEIEQDQPALFLLLEELQSTVGVDVQQRIDALLEALQPPAPCSARPQDRETEVFLCYCSQDRPTALAIRAALIEAGISVWQDVDRMQGGARFGIELKQAILRSDAVAVLVSRAATARPWVENEVHYAVEKRKPIVPLFLEPDVEKMMAIFSLHHIHLYADWEAGMNKLVQRLRRVKSGEVGAVPEFQPSTGLRVDAAVAPQGLGQEDDPFIYGPSVPPEMFVGRKAALNTIRSRVGQPDSLQCLSIVANRRMGKTSLLRYIAQNCQSLFRDGHRYAAVYVDAMDPRAHTCEGFMRLLRRNVSRQLGRELWPEARDGKLAILSESLEELAVREDVRLILLLDEWEGVMAYQDMDELIDALRACASMGWIGMITATAYRLSDLKEQGKLTSPFPNIFSEAYLGNLPPNEWRELIRQGFAGSALVPAASDYALVGDLAGGHPYLTQLAGSVIWQAHRQDWDQARVRSAFAEQARMIFTAIWQGLGPDQIQAVRTALGLGFGSPVPENVTIGLKSRGVLTEAGDVFCTPFAEFTRQELER